MNNEIIDFINEKKRIDKNLELMIEELKEFKKKLNSTTLKTLSNEYSLLHKNKPNLSTYDVRELMAKYIYEIEDYITGLSNIHLVQNKICSICNEKYSHGMFKVEGNYICLDCLKNFKIKIGE